MLDCWDQDLLFELSQYLTVADLLHLRVCSTKLRNKIEYSPIWQLQCQKLWLDRELMDSLHVGNLHKCADWFASFMERSQIGMQIRGKLKILTTMLPYDKQYWNLATNLLDDPLGWKNIPFLYRWLQTSQMETPFDTLRLVHQLLITIRQKPLMELILREDKIGNRLDNSQYDYETLLMIINTIDNSFENLLPMRNKFYEQLNAKILSHDLLFKTGTFEEQIQMIAVELLNLIKTNVKSLDMISTLEDLMILRVYSGETKGEPIVLLTILHHVCEKYKIPVRLTFDYLIFDNDTRFLTITNELTLKIFTREQIIESVGSLNFDRFITQVDNYNLHLFISSRLNDIFDSRWTLQVDKSMNRLNDLFPHSKLPLDVANVIGYTTLTNVCNSMYHIGINGSVIHMIESTIVKYMPWNLYYLHSARRPWHTELEYMDWLTDKYMLDMMATTQNMDILGEFKLNEIGELVCIIGVQRVFYHQPDIFVSTVDCTGSVKVKRLIDLADANTATGQITNEINRFLQNPQLRAILGTWFHNLDHHVLKMTSTEWIIEESFKNQPLPIATT